MLKRSRFTGQTPIGWVFIACIVLMLAGVAGYLLWLFLPHKYDPGATTTNGDVAYYTKLPPPPEASNVRVASFHHMIMRLVFVRFSAPADICLNYAKAVAKVPVLKPLDDGQTGMDIGLIQNGSGVFQDLRWFDLPYAKGDWAVQAGNPVFRRPTVESVNYKNPHPEMVGADSNIGLPTYGQSSVRVDTDRGVFYFLQAN